MLKLPKKLESIVLGLSATAMSFSSFNCSTPPTAPPENDNHPIEEVITQTSNQDGFITFPDGRKIQLKNSNTNQPIPNKDLTYNTEHGVTYSTDSNYVPLLEFLGPYQGRETTTIYLKPLDPNGNGYTTLETLSNTKENIMYTWRSDNLMNYSQHTYVKTLDREDYITGTEKLVGFLSTIFDKTLSAFGVNLPPETNLEDLAGLLNWNPEAERYDMFEFKGTDIPTSIDFVPSNIPWIETDDLEIIDNKVKLRFYKFDKEVYDDIPNYTQTRADPTIFLGPTTHSDLETKIQFTNLTEGGSTSWMPWNNSPFQTGELDPGNYRISIRIKDEVDNESEKNIFFTIGNSQNPFQVIAEYDAPSNNTNGLTWANLSGYDFLYTCDPTTDKIYRLNSNMVLGLQEDAPCEDISGLAWDGNNLWCSDSETNILYKMNKYANVISSWDTNIHTTSTRINDITNLVDFSGGNWIGGVYQDGNLFSYEEPSHTSFCGACLEDYTPPKGIAFHENNYYVYGNDKLLKLTFDSPPYWPTPAEEYDFPVDVNGIDWNTENLWSCSGNKVYKHAPE